MIYLNEDIEGVKKYYPNIPDNTFMTLISLDPTYRDGSGSLGKYGKWILNLYKNGELNEQDFGEITPLLNQFNIYKNRIQNTDLLSYKTIDALSQELARVVDDTSMLTDRQKTRFNKNVKAGRIIVDKSDDYDIVYEDDEYIVCVPNTHEASMKLGKGTNWCTAHDSDRYYIEYTADGTKLYIIKRKSTGERWQFCEKSPYDEGFSFMDEHDDEFDYYEEFSGSDMYEWMQNQFPHSLGTVEFEVTHDTIRVPDDMRERVVSAIINDVDYINPRMFYECSHLERVKFNSDVVAIGRKAFYRCESLRHIKLPQTLDRIGQEAFAGCGSLYSVDFPKKMDEIGADAFSSTNLGVLSTECGVIGHHAFHNSDLRIISIKNCARVMADAFSGCTNLDMMAIQFVNTEHTGIVGVIGAGAFYQCSTLHIAQVTGVSVIDDEAFLNCRKLNICIYGNVIRIGRDAFKGVAQVLTDSQFVKDYCDKNNVPCRIVAKYPKNE